MNRIFVKVTKDKTMKDLYLIRHAKSDWSNPDWTDFERPLNKRGLDNAPRMGEFLKEQNVLPDIIYSSDANRALSTAQILAEKIGYPINKIIKQHSIYESGVQFYLELITGIDDNMNSAFVVGHNPTQTVLINYLTDAGVSHLPTCGVAHIQVDSDSWEYVSKSTGRLLNLFTPKKLWGDTDD